MSFYRLLDKEEGRNELTVEIPFYLNIKIIVKRKDKYFEATKSLIELFSLPGNCFPTNTNLKAQTV